MAQFKVGDLIQCDAHADDWGYWGVTRDCGEWFEIRSGRGDRVLFKSEPGWSKVSK